MFPLLANQEQHSYKHQFSINVLQFYQHAKKKIGNSKKVNGLEFLICSYFFKGKTKFSVKLKNLLKHLDNYISDNTIKM